MIWIWHHIHLGPLRHLVLKLTKLNHAVDEKQTTCDKTISPPRPPPDDDYAAPPMLLSRQLRVLRFATGFTDFVPNSNRP